MEDWKLGGGVAEVAIIALCAAAPFSLVHQTNTNMNNRQRNRKLTRKSVYTRISNSDSDNFQLE